MEEIFWFIVGVFVICWAAAAKATSDTIFLMIAIMLAGFVSGSGD